MKVLLTLPAYLQVDLRFGRHNCKSIDFYDQIDVLFVCIFTTVLGPASIIVKMDGKSAFHRLWERYFTKSLIFTKVLARKKNTIKLVVFNMQKSL